MVLNRKDQSIEHKQFKDIIDYLEPGDCLVRNNTKVIPARLYGKKATGAKIEFLLLNQIEGDVWESIVRPGHKLKPGTEVEFGDGLLKATVLDIMPGGTRKVEFKYEGIFNEILDKIGLMPLPPYIHESLKDNDRYQTVYARYEGSAAAPTAGLHFTPELFEKLKQKGVEVANVTLHVGIGTFRPVKVENVEEHHMHSEHYYIKQEDAEKINSAKAETSIINVDSGKWKFVINPSKHLNLYPGYINICVSPSVGFTIPSSSAIVSNTLQDGMVKPTEGDTQIFIYPGYKFKCLDGLITNFHLPESTLIMLVSALAGKEYIMKAYNEAVKERYRFFSFGDAMFIN